MLADFGARAIRLLPPEAAHNATLRLLTTGLGVPGRAPQLAPGLKVTLPKSGLTFASPVGLAAGFDKNCEVPDAMARFGFGFVECGTVTPKPQAGNPKPRLFRLEEDRAVINRMGFNNFGLDYFIRRLARYSHAVPIGANVGANKDSEDRAGDYVTGIEAVAPYADYITINISSPNTPGLRALQGRDALDDLLGRVAQARTTPAPVFLKIAPDLSPDEIALIVEAALANRIDALIVSNTTLDRPASLRSRDRAEAGGLSGAPLKEKAHKALIHAAEAAKGRLPLIAVGGIDSGAEAYRRIRAGASAVQIYSALIYGGPGLVGRIKRDLAARLRAGGFASVAEAAANPVLTER
jgi:dihydroorotate dehydrogenase